ncbi:flavodoxin domain-containing protein [Rhodanobacter sp. Si-c]|uniref:Flavodoxin domain-containing protein n=1 Tax=Rhodanobacter lycopersici TaxID=3162487 RepID=A0ABV3QBB4_9GAMM
MGMFQPVWLQELIGEPAGSRPAAPAEPVTGMRFVPDPVLIAYASQTGVAEDLAAATHEQLRGAGVASQVVDFEALDRAMLESASQVLFLVSTTYDGDRPDMAETFSHMVMVQSASLAQLHYGLLALGDRGYEDFCGFGRTLDAWLQANGAQAWFPRIEVDDEDACALEHWHAQVAALAAPVTAWRADALSTERIA